MHNAHNSILQLSSIYQKKKNYSYSLELKLANQQNGELRISFIIQETEGRHNVYGHMHEAPNVTQSNLNHPTCI